MKELKTLKVEEMNNKKIFDDCVREAIKMGRQYMSYSVSDEPTQQEWELALLIFANKLKTKYQNLGEKNERGLEKSE